MKQVKKQQANMHAIFVGGVTLSFILLWMTIGHADHSIANQNIQKKAVEARIYQAVLSSVPKAPDVPVVQPPIPRSFSRQSLADRHVVLIINAPGRKTEQTLLALQEHPEWIVKNNGLLGEREIVDAKTIAMDLRQGKIGGIRLVQSAEIFSAQQDAKNVTRAQTSGIAKPGYAFDAGDVGEQIASAFMDEKAEVTVETTYEKPHVIVTLPDGSQTTLKLLATGLSDFANSTPGRDWNVHKAIEQHVNNIVLPADQIFSITAALDVPITLKKGWKEDLGLFGGAAALTPGAGICQSVTTLYRAVLLAGLPIVEQRNHSAFVDHYEPLGIGLDATMFPGVQDFRFRNDTGEQMLIQAYIEGPTVFVNFFGNDDGRTATLNGPYFYGSKNRPSALRPLTRNQIGWVRTITFADGSTKEEPLYATYIKPVWLSMIKKYDGADGMKLLTTMLEDL